MKKILAFILMFLCAFGLIGCSQKAGPEPDKAEVETVEGADAYKIGVIVYNLSDEEVLAFRSYLEDYIAEVFPGITFVYSESISNEEQELAFIKEACEEGVSGFLSFLSRDLKKEVELCAQNKVYYMLASGSVSDEDFAAVEDNPYFIGAVGPGNDLEYNAGYDMAGYFLTEQFGNDYFILSGGAGYGNEMHLQRTIGILDRLQEDGAKFDQPSETIALSQEPVYLSAGDLKVCVVPGYISRDEFYETAKKEYKENPYSVVLSVLPIAKMADDIQGSHLGVVDCYSTTNLQLFNSGLLRYVAGKYSSTIGPSFAAMYNAVTGYAQDFRENGKAFRITQGFWYSADLDDYIDKYTMANSVVKNAYNYEDLGKVCKVFNPDATLEDLQNLANAYSYDEALERRGE